MLQESEEEEMDTFGIEMNSWVDTVLKVVYDKGQGRDIIFSSFHPDICLMLSLKQVCTSVPRRGYRALTPLHSLPFLSSS